MQAENYSRPASGFRFANGGMKITSTPDSLPPDKYPFLQNVRGYRSDSLRSRPQVSQFVGAAVNGAVQSMEPTLGVSKKGGVLYNHGTALVAGYDTLIGSSLIPFRPNKSPVAWEYVFDRITYSKVLIQGGGNVVQKMGIAEPASPCDAGPHAFDFDWSGPSPVYVQGGTASAVTSTNTRTNDSVQGPPFGDGLGPGGTSLVTTIRLSVGANLAKGMAIQIGVTATKVLDVFPANSNPIQVMAIRYYAGIIGRAVIVPNNIGSGPGQDQSIYNEILLSTLRRGALIELNDGVRQEFTMIQEVSVGPDGSIAFEVITQLPWTSVSTNFTMAPAIQVPGDMTGVASGTTVTIKNLNYTMTAGHGWQTTTASLSGFVPNLGSFQEEDELHFSLQIGGIQFFTEGKLLLDCGDGSFTQNLYVYSFRLNDVQAGIPLTDGSTVTDQLGIEAISLQRQIIDEETTIQQQNTAKVRSSYLLSLGDGQWSELTVKLKDLIRVGNDQTKNLMTINSMRLLLTCTGGITVGFVTPDVFGGFQPDVTQTGIPYKYRIRPRSSLTGAKGNPSAEMKYGVNPRRMSVYVTLPTTYPDPQVDMWDVFRQGGSIDDYVLVGSIPIGATGFIDNYQDIQVSNAQILEEDNFEPFPTILPMLSNTGAVVVGHTVVVSLLGFTVAQAMNLLPGNIIEINQQEFTLAQRPTVFGPGLWILVLNENAGVFTGEMIIEEPTIAQLAGSNFLPAYAWGPDVNGVIFAVGDSNRPGYVYKTKPFNPDASADDPTELTPPSEPLIGGCLANGTSIVFSTKRAWRGYPGRDSAGNLKYNWLEIPVSEGAFMGFCIASDGDDIYYGSRDGIRKIGERFPVTNDDLYDLFPHEGKFSSNYTYSGQTVYAPDYTKKDLFRMSIINKFLYFDYRDTGGVPRTLVCDLRTNAWSVDVYVEPITIHAGTTNLLVTPGTITLNEQLWLGGMDGSEWNMILDSAIVAGTGEQVACVVATKEEDAGDTRAKKQFGDLILDSTSPNFTGIQVTPLQYGTPVAGVAPTTIAALQANRAVRPIDLAGGQLLNQVGLMIMWTDQGTITTLYNWQPSYIPKPEDVYTRFTDWDDQGSEENKFYQGFVLEADTYGIIKQVQVRDADMLTIQQVFNCNHNGQSEQAYTFTNPFLAHSVRLEPVASGGANPMRIFGVRWVWEKSPESVLNWKSQSTGHQFNGYQHIGEIMLPYRSTAVVIVTITVDNGTPLIISFPSTGGQYQKISLRVPPNKGFLFQYSVTSASPFQLWVDDIEVSVKPWGESGEYRRVKLLGGEMGSRATI